MDQKVAIKEVVQGITDAHPVIQGCWEKVDLLVKERIEEIVAYALRRQIGGSFVLAGPSRAILQSQDGA
eukprot:5259954-Ditylum_brightwellii.AAC.1